ncbi:hypothetical protein A3D78_04465 [Candidatus Gottesmanbacteria bacterium RIFCSPHIGHO2_02_FULL_39_14]|uniref:PIN domain-containing protein n=3 Tax=Candidatus Gottesmaniibacteriota TaxID=1752720 RepID=A0A1F6A3R5_9BACT|nr:MAG: hypothetical protein A2153_01395 [Candidatus Gottesmanbacteria bacterium RBG_16_38_7b]OGG19102.1 MAG: hypothetical protein A3D78_04465 [Candidatus Gottesmanbacteria bacterium RIFCSPHIGHO2_02_FULL_39_14]OGG30858.1 MAG: hypothetical protein A3I51_01495 [Candidatus Gottesmanbacteria bacterium RIFCSPLOWO2_02_FULL_38_8]
MIVVDASVAIKWIEKEEDSEKAVLLQKSHLLKQNEIIVPQLIYFEIANTLSTKSKVEEKYIELGINIVYNTDLKIEQLEKVDLLKASNLAKKYKTSVYDMIYAVVAKKYDTILITTDEKFIQKTKFSYVKLLSEYTAGTKT